MRGSFDNYRVEFNSLATQCPPVPVKSLIANFRAGLPDSLGNGHGMGTNQGYTTAYAKE